MCSNKIVRMADLPIHMVVRIFSELNRGKLIIISGYDQETIVTDTNPKYLTYPDGWYFESGVFTNKYNTSTGRYSEAKTVNNSGKAWTGVAGCLPDKGKQPNKKDSIFSSLFGGSFSFVCFQLKIIHFF